MLTNPWIPRALLILVLLLAIVAQDRRLVAERRHSAALALDVSNIEAERDSTRELRRSDSVRWFTRRVMQVPQHADALDHELKADRAASYAMAVRVDTVRMQAPIVDSLSHYDIRQEPYTVSADIARGALALAIVLDPIRLTARVECGRADRDGVRPASVITSVPKWASVQLAQLEQSPDVCRAQPAEVPHRRHFEFAPLVIGAGRLLRSETNGWGMFVGSGLRIRF